MVVDGLQERGGALVDLADSKTISFRPTRYWSISHGQRSQVPATGVHGFGPRRERTSRRPSQATRPPAAHRHYGAAPAPSGSARRGIPLLQLLDGFAAR